MAGFCFDLVAGYGVGCSMVCCGGWLWVWFWWLGMVLLEFVLSLAAGYGVRGGFRC